MAPKRFGPVSGPELIDGLVSAVLLKFPGLSLDRLLLHCEPVAHDGSWRCWLTVSDPRPSARPPDDAQDPGEVVALRDLVKTLVLGSTFSKQFPDEMLSCVFLVVPTAAWEMARQVAEGGDVVPGPGSGQGDEDDDE